jgi:hypothetical protein
MLILLSGRLSGSIADEYGRQKSFSLLRFLLWETPAFVLELIASGFVAAYFYIKFPLKLKMVRKKK